MIGYQPYIIKSSRAVTTFSSRVRFIDLINRDIVVVDGVYAAESNVPPRILRHREHLVDVNQAGAGREQSGSGHRGAGIDDLRNVGRQHEAVIADAADLALVGFRFAAVIADRFEAGDLLDVGPRICVRVVDERHGKRLTAVDHGGLHDFRDVVGVVALEVSSDAIEDVETQRLINR